MRRHLAREAAIGLLALVARRAEWDEAQHPRVPAGDPDGGEFAPANGGATKAAPATEEQKAKAFEMHKAGHSYKKIQEETGLNPKQAATIIHKMKKAVKGETVVEGGARQVSSGIQEQANRMRAEYEKNKAQVEELAKLDYENRLKAEKAIRATRGFREIQTEDGHTVEIHVANELAKTVPNSVLLTKNFERAVAKVPNSVLRAAADDDLNDLGGAQPVLSLKSSLHSRLLEEKYGGVAAGLYHPRDNMVEVSAAGFHASGVQMQNTLNHELGHAVHYTNPSLFGGDKAVHKAWVADSRHGKALNDKDISFGQNHHDYVDTTYYRTNHKESIAESFGSLLSKRMARDAYFKSPTSMSASWLSLAEQRAARMEKLFPRSTGLAQAALDKLHPEVAR